MRFRKKEGMILDIANRYPSGATDNFARQNREQRERFNRPKTQSKSTYQAKSPDNQWLGGVNKG